jgi:CTP:molybdopterin cytidylyltransferase MocA
MGDRLSAVIFEGGAPDSPVQRAMTSVRRGITLDNLAKLLKLSEFDEVILCTNYPELAAEAQALGATVDLRMDAGTFHFGLRLRELIYDRKLDKLLFMGGAAAPLIRPDELAEVARMTRATDSVVVVNNPQSPDLVAFSPAAAIDLIELPESDNVLGHLLRVAGLPRVLMPNTSTISFDVDTPADMIILSLLQDAGPRTREALKALSLDDGQVQAAKKLFVKQGAAFALIGRVSPAVCLFINANFALRLRVFSEERGMRALGRVERGEVRSLVAQFLDTVGPRRFFEHLAEVAEVAFFDTRVWMAHNRLEVTEADRFYSDLGEVDLIQNAQLRDFTEAAFEAPIPVILGGHSLVAGGLWALAESILVQEGREPIRPF